MMIILHGEDIGAIYIQDISGENEYDLIGFDKNKTSWSFNHADKKHLGRIKHIDDLEVLKSIFPNNFSNRHEICGICFGNKVVNKKTYNFYLKRADTFEAYQKIKYVWKKFRTFSTKMEWDEYRNRVKCSISLCKEHGEVARANIQKEVDKLLFNQTVDNCIMYESVLEDILTGDIEQIEEGMTLIGRQLKLPGGTMDVFAEDKLGRKCIIELKTDGNCSRLVDQCKSYKETANFDARIISIAPYYSTKNYVALKDLGYVEVKQYYMDNVTSYVRDYKPSYEIS